MTYTTPTAAELKTRFPAFASVADATVDYWIADAEGPVGVNWDETERPNGVMLFAAHNMALLGFASGAGTVPAGVTSFKSGTFAVAVSDKLAGASGIYATLYGRMYSDLCRRLFGGARLVRTADHV